MLITEDTRLSFSFDHDCTQVQYLVGSKSHITPNGVRLHTDDVFPLKPDGVNISSRCVDLAQLYFEHSFSLCLIRMFAAPRRPIRLLEATYGADYILSIEIEVPQLVFFFIA
eukprot:m.401801 g.401801  ORF g.401801 m.401801 type:complete len:112 (+) comp21170_c0_seq32:1548-1883(+)